MALIKCPECGKQVSDKAEVCPHCGVEVQKVLEELREKERQRREEQRQKQKKRTRRILITMASLCVVAAIAIVGYLYSIDALNSIPSDYRKQTEGYFVSAESAINECGFVRGTESLDALKDRTLTKRQTKHLERIEKALAEMGLNDLGSTLDSIAIKYTDPMMQQAKEIITAFNSYQLDASQTERLYLAKDRYVELILAEMEDVVGHYEAQAQLIHFHFEVINRLANSLHEMQLSRSQSVRLEEAVNKAERLLRQKEEFEHKQQLKAIRDEYIRLLSDNKADDSDFGYSEQGYFLYDIDDDGIPELWIKTGTCEADYRILVYTYGNGIRKIYDESAGHTSFYKGDGYVLKVYGHMGMTNWDKLTYNGYSMTETTIYAGDSTYEGDDDMGGNTIKPEEKLVKLYSLTNKQPILNAFKTD